MTPSEGAAPTVFVVNSEPDFLLVIRELLEESGCIVHTMRIVDDPFDAIIAAAPDLLLLDFPHRNADAWTLLDRIAAHPVTDHTPLIATSTDADNLHQVPEHSGDQRVVMVLLKPFDIVLIHDLATSILKRS